MYRQREVGEKYGNIEKINEIWYNVIVFDG